MQRPLLPALFIVILVSVAWISMLDLAFCVPVSEETGNYESSFTFTIQNGYVRSDHTLYVSIPPSLRQYYDGKSHTLNGDGDYAKFITPGAVQSIADNIRNITLNAPYSDEEFVNAVLMIVRGINYVRSDAKYSVETIVDNQADCDGLSILAASILKAGGLDVVLLLYKGINPTHMNIGVNLDHMPISHSWWTSPTGVEYDNKTYWVAECTSLSDWTVGDRPELLASDKPQVIPLNKCEKLPPACISSSLDSKMEKSSIFINLSTSDFNASGYERTMNVSGSILPIFSNRTITFYANQPGYCPDSCVTNTDEFGNYALLWNVTLPGTYNLKTSWSGFSNYSGSDSETLTVFIDSRQPVVEVQSDSLGTNSLTWNRPQGYSPGYTSLFNQDGKEFLKNKLAATDIVLSGDFMVLTDGNEIAPNETTVTIPAHQRTYKVPGTRRTFIIDVPEETITIPGAELLYGQFGFVLGRDEANNYTASVKLLTSEDVLRINESSSQSKSLYVNASEMVTKNTWYKAVAKVSKAEVVVEVADENGQLVEKKVGQSLNELGVIMAYPVGQVLAFKNLKVESKSQSQNSMPISDSQMQVTGYDHLYQYIRIALLLAGAALAIVCLRDRRIKNKYSNDNESVVH